MATTQEVQFSIPMTFTATVNGDVDIDSPDFLAELHRLAAAGEALNVSIAGANFVLVEQVDGENVTVKIAA